ncbi:MAG: hypothetical protein M3297_04405 [Thermoproteota archaeon]|jgi:hypothetical protein|nr:hypothetical protein [Thermoproteota archaeon]
MSRVRLQRYRNTIQNDCRPLLIDDSTDVPLKILSFEEICPQWSFALSRGFSTNPCLDIEDGKNCIVGEAHGFRDSAYICSKCWEYSQSFVSSIHGNGLSGYFLTDSELFESIKNEFVQHFNQKHAYKKSKIAKILHDVHKLTYITKFYHQHFSVYHSTMSTLS